MFTLTIPALGEFGTNCYLVWGADKKGALIDAPCNAEHILSVIDSKGIILEKILLTHGHCDHIAAAAEIADKTGAQVVIHTNDLPKLTDNAANLADFFDMPPVTPVENAVTCEDGDVISIGSGEIEFEVLHTPGHTSGSVCYIADDRMYVGDTIFKGSMGRTDMYDGDEDTLFSTLAMLYEFDVRTDYLLLPGHGEQTYISEERMNNRYLIYAYKRS